VPWPKGKPRSEETKAKMRAAHVGRTPRPQTEETKAKISATRRARYPQKPPRPPKPKRGWKWSEEQKRRLSEAKKGSVISAKTRNSMSIAHKKRWAKMTVTERKFACAIMQVRQPGVVDPRRPRAKRPCGNCQTCGIWRRSLHREHIIPKYKGGSEEANNIQWICANCHEDKTREDLRGRPGGMKGRKHSEETRMKMRISAALRTNSKKYSSQ
jgi:hypothetical protein